MIVNLGSEQPFRDNPGYSKRINEKFSWKPDSLRSRCIVCFLAQSSGQPKWEEIFSYCQKHGVKAWEMEHEISQQKMLYTIADNKKKKIIEKIASRSNMLCRRKVAYPSENLKHLVKDAMHQALVYSMSEVYVGYVSKDVPGVYLFFENGYEYPLYVGQTRSLATRFHSRLQEDNDPISRYLLWVAGLGNFDLSQWSLRFIPIGDAQNFAVQGQLTPDLTLDLSARNLLEDIYTNDSKWALDVAEAALITNFCPHLNQRMSTGFSPLPLHRQDYCQQYCEHL